MPIYFEWFLQVKEEVDKLVAELGVEDMMDDAAGRQIPGYSVDELGSLFESQSFSE